MERGRLALAVRVAAVPANKNWLEETSEALLKALKGSLTDVPEPGKPWPAMQTWLGAVAQLTTMKRRSVADCRDRLIADEALVQLFFDPNSGYLRALWLQRGNDLQLARRPPA